MSKILYISNFRDGTGWSNAAINYAMAMDEVGLDVAIRSIKLNNAISPVPEKIDELEQKSIRDCDICIQHVLPNMMEYNGKFRKNIGMFASETSNFRQSRWQHYLNMMDEAWVFCGQQLEACKASGVKKPIHVVHHCFDVNKYTQSYEPLTLPVNKDDFIFYYIGEFSKRKNILAIVQAFQSEFHRHEPVQLLLKVNIPGKSNAETMEFVGNFCNNIKVGLKRYNNYDLYKKELIIAEHLSERDLMRLHASCNCFVLASKGEACCIPAVEAAAMDNAVICSDNIGTVDYLSVNGENMIVATTPEVCFGEENQIPYLYTSDETWENVNVQQLANSMRIMFNNRYKKHVGMNSSFTAENFNYVTIGNRIKELINV